jgi:hypothetical protein
MWFAVIGGDQRHPLIIEQLLNEGYEIDRASMEHFLQDPKRELFVEFNRTVPNHPDSPEGESTYKGTLVLNGSRAKADAIIIPPSNYERWVPEAGKDEETPGNKITFKVSLCMPDDENKIPAETCKFRFELLDASKEPGVCANWPLNASNDYDMQFVAKDNPNLVIKSKVIAETKEDVAAQTAEITITNFDWGAHSRLRVTAILDDGKSTEVIAHLKGEKGTREITVPLDKNNNYIADAWEKEMNTFGLDGDWDKDDIPANQRRNGDGYSHYEEYRGFHTLNQDHLRTNPLKKDLFVYDKDGLVNQYFGKDNSADNPAEITLHFLAANQYRENRHVNINSETFKIADQYLVYVLKGGGELAGEAEGVANGIASGQSLKFTKSVMINTEGLRQSTTGLPSATRDKLTEILIKETVAHEIGHALSIKHHGSDVNGKSSNTTVKTQGVIGCVMRYESDEEYASVNADNNYSLSGFHSGDHYCRSVEFWTLNGQQKASDNCWGQINVKMDK